MIRRWLKWRYARKFVRDVRAMHRDMAWSLAETTGKELGLHPGWIFPDEGFRWAALRRGKIMPYMAQMDFLIDRARAHVAAMAPVDEAARDRRPELYRQMMEQDR